jgi:hypothetical protein
MFAFLAAQTLDTLPARGREREPLPIVKELGGLFIFRRQAPW